MIPNQLTSERSQSKADIPAGRRVHFESTRSLWERRRDLSATSVAAIIIAAGNVVALASLPWTQSHIFGDTSPATWLCLGLLMPVYLISCSLYRAYWNSRDENNAVIEKLGPYLLKEKIGAGGMGDVFLAEHQLMKRKCAVKLIHSDQARDREMRDSFEQEAKATAQLTHWNTIEVYDYGTSTDGRFYYVMEYLQGVNLSQFVQSYGPMSSARVAYILKQMCEALYEAECIGLVHRDIKPSNIFLTERGRSYDVAKLLDFGLVQAVSKDPIGVNKVSTKLRGSPAYMCPEQAIGMDPDCRGDLYSLGCVAYYLLTGRPPFTDENPIMLVVAHATTAVPTFKEIGVDVADDMTRVVLKCLEREASSRYSSARELLDDLEACECGNEWTWRCAEQWWHEHQPRTPSLSQDEPKTEAELETLQLTDRDTSPDSIPIRETVGCATSDHEIATVIYDPVSVK